MVHIKERVQEGMIARRDRERRRRKVLMTQMSALKEQEVRILNNLFILYLQTLLLLLMHIITKNYYTHTHSTLLLFCIFINFPSVPFLPLSLLRSVGESRC